MAHTSEPSRVRLEGIVKYPCPMVDLTRVAKANAVVDFISDRSNHSVWVVGLIFRESLEMNF